MPKAKSNNPEGATTNKSQFIRSFPTAISAAEIVAEGGKIGLTFSEAYVHTIRSKAKTQGTPSGRRGRKPGRPAKTVEKSSVAPSNSGLERQLIELALEVGVNRARELIELVLKRVHDSAIN